ncbi:MAG: hypothetical protein V1779_04930 [bacterium]
MSKKNRHIIMYSLYKMESIILLTVLMYSCSRPPSYTRYTFTPEDNPSVFKQDKNDWDINKEIIFKLHMRDGSVYIMKDWKINDGDSVITGFGGLLDVNRNLIKKDNFTIFIKDIALVETNELNTNPSIITLALVTGASLGMTIYCIMNPKACFGSCPTFYASNGSEMQLQAEGFSGAIAPSLEDKDIDALYFAKGDNGNLLLKMKNEALETHVVRYADILAVPKSENSRVFTSGEGKFYKTENIISPASVKAEEGVITEKLIKFDNRQRFSLADSNDLAKKEFIEINFKDLPAGEKGLILAYRQTLMTTFIFYSTLGYMGNSAGNYFAMLERDDGSFMKSVYGSKEVLGGIKVYVQDKNEEWKDLGEFFELGPISTDIQLLKLNESIHGDCKLRLELTKGLWRLDYLALANKIKEVQPIRIQPSYVIKENSNDKKAFEELTDNAQTLATLPGDEYLINYKLPDEYQDYEIFLESKGYYIEWMRKEWTKNENPLMLSKLILNPKQFFKDIAPEFKKLEPNMEESFWRSKYVR